MWTTLLMGAAPRGRRLHALDQRGRAEAAAAAHRDEPEAAAAALELVQRRGQQARAGRPERVADRDRAAVDVHVRGVRRELALPRADHGGEGLVDLDHVELVDREPVA